VRFTCVLSLSCPLLPLPPRLKDAGRTSIGLLLRELGGTILAWNAGCEHLFGIPAAAAVGRPVRTLLGAAPPGSVEEAEAALRREGHWSGELALHLPDGRVRRVATCWLLHAPGEGAPLVLEAALPLPDEGWPALDGLEAAAGFGTWELDLALGSAWLSPACRALHGLPAEGEPLAPRAWLALLHPQDRAPVLRAARTALRGSGAVRCRFRLRPPGQAERWVEARGGCPGPRRLLGILLDITAQKAEEERTALVMREVGHRARNALASVQALLRLTRAETPRAYARALEGRIAALGRAHALLANESWSGAALRDLLEAEFAPYVADTPARLALEGPPVALEAGTVQPLSMAVHELVTNAAKHGALSRPEGRVRLSWQVGAEGLRLAWLERGGPPLPGPPPHRGFGSSLLRSLVEVQLGGSASLRWEREGLACEILLPRRALTL
jgi:two-component sensor histidine kinase